MGWCGSLHDTGISFLLNTFVPIYNRLSHILKKVSSVINGFGVAVVTNLRSQRISGR